MADYIPVSVERAIEPDTPSLPLSRCHLLPYLPPQPEWFGYFPFLNLTADRIRKQLIHEDFSLRKKILLVYFIIFHVN